MSATHEIPATLVRQPFLRDLLQCFVVGLTRAVNETCETAAEYAQDGADGIATFGEGWSDDCAIDALAAAREVAMRHLVDHPGSRWGDIAGQVIKAYDDLGDTAEVSGDVAASAACEVLETLMREAGLTTAELLPANHMFGAEPVAPGSAILHRDLAWEGVMRDWRIDDGEDDELTPAQKQDFAVRLSGGDGSLFLEIETTDGPMAIAFEMDRGAAKFWTYQPTGPGMQPADDTNAIIRVDERGTHVTANDPMGGIEHVIFGEEGAQLTGEWQPARKDAPEEMPTP